MRPTAVPQQVMADLERLSPPLEFPTKGSDYELNWAPSGASVSP